MKTNSKPTWTQWTTFCALIALPFTSSAQTNVKTVNLNAGIDQLLGTAGYDGVDFIVRPSVDPGQPILDKNTLLFFDAPPADKDWRNEFWQWLQYMQFSSEDGAYRKAYLACLDGTGNITDLYNPSITVEHFALDNVDMDPGPVQLRLLGSSLSWRMENGRYYGLDNTPTFSFEAPLSMTAVSGTSELYGWAGLIASRTALRVDPGATLTIKESGNPASPLPADQLYFDYFELAGSNTADIDNSTLTLDHSGVIFQTGTTPQIAAGTVTEGFVVRNGGLFALTGTVGTFDSTKLELRGSMLVDSSALTLGLRNLLTVSSDLYLANATVSLAEDASIIVSDETLVSGTTTISTTKANPPFGPGFRGALALQDSSTVLNITGTGRAFSSFVTMSGGTLNIDLDPGSDPFFVFGDEATPLFFRGGGQVNISPGNFLEIRSGILDMNQGGSMAIHNQGIIWVEGGIFKGPGTVTGTGTVYVADGGEVQVLDPSSPLVLHQLDMAIDSAIQLGINPTAGTASRIEAAGVLLDASAIPFAPVLNLQLSGDTALPVGTKFVLADYDQLAGNVNAPQFRDLPEGHVFQRGLNQYQIRYSDADYGTSHGGNSTVITLTVVPDTHPIAGADAVDRFPSQSVKVSVATLLSNDVDPETGTNAGLSITAVNNPGASPATVTLSGGTVFYSPNGHLTADTFEYTVQNSLGQTATGTVTVSLIVDTTPSQNFISFKLLGDGSAETVFGGIPGRTYRIQTTEDLINWADAATVVADGVGRLTFTDPGPLPPRRAYRTVSP